MLLFLELTRGMTTKKRTVDPRVSRSFLERTIRKRMKRPPRRTKNRLTKETKILNFPRRRSLKRKNKLKLRRETKYNKCSLRKTVIQGLRAG